MPARSLIVTVLALALLTLTACGPSAPADGGGSADAAADAVEAYLTAKVAGDIEALRPLLCSELEARLQAEALSFSAVTGVTIVGMDCARNASPNAQGQITVTCTGEIRAEYGAETETFPLRTYRVVEEDGVWRWCGETAP
ncbi:MAG: hypothetical protein ACUVS2_17210 [Candidatus Flexifilum sp.]|jgi:hypothetical protein